MSLRVAALLIALVTLPYARPSHAEEVFAGKTVRIIVPSNSLATAYGLYGSLASSHLSRFLPGKPSVVVSTMPGAAGLLAANHLYNVAPKDGTTLLVISQAFATEQVLRKPGVRYDAARYNFIARLSTNVPLHFIWRTTKVSTVTELKEREVLTGAVGGGGFQHDLPRAMNALLGTKWKIIGGYAGGNDVRIAMERGEVQAAISPVALFHDLLQPWQKGGSEAPIRPVVQYSDFRHASFGDVPHIVELADSDDAKAILKFLVNVSTIGRSIVAPPDVPASTINILRKAFAEMLLDGKFREDTAKRGADLDSWSGDELANYVQAVLRTPSSIVEMVEAATKKN